MSYLRILSIFQRALRSMAAGKRSADINRVVDLLRSFLASSRFTNITLKIIT